MNKYKVYKYTNKVNGKVYIGQTRQSIEDRAKGRGWGYSKCPRFSSAIKRYGWDNFVCEILQDGLTREEADLLETQYIRYYRDELGISYNLEDGGKSKGPHRNTEEVKRLLSESMKGKNVGENNGMYGKPSPMRVKIYKFNNTQLIHIYSSIGELSKELNIQSSQLCSYFKYPCIKVGEFYFSKKEYITQEDLQNAFIYQKTAVQILQYGSDGKLIRIHNSTKEASIYSGISESTFRAHRLSPWKSRGYVWVFGGTPHNCNDIINEFNKIELKNYRPKLSTDFETTNIDKFDLSGNYVQSFDSFAHVRREEGISVHTISNTYNGPYIFNDFIWCNSSNKLYGLDLVIEAIKNTSSLTTKVMLMKFDETGRFMRCYESVESIKREEHLSRDTIGHYIQNGPFRYKGHIWVDVVNLYPINTLVERSKNNIVTPKPNMGRAVVKMINGEVIETYKNMVALARILGVSRDRLRNGLKKGIFELDGCWYKYL